MQRTDISPEAHIARIRRTRFGLGSDGTVIKRNPLSDDLHHAIEHLSEGLYSEDIHFVLELIQNAEDNSYHKEQQPELVFWLLLTDPTRTTGAEGALLVANNEIGFQAKNVEALCAVGKSTKKKHEGYIGEKGIGFKSVEIITIYDILPPLYARRRTICCVIRTSRRKPTASWT